MIINLQNTPEKNVKKKNINSIEMCVQCCFEKEKKTNFMIIKSMNQRNEKKRERKAH